MNNVFRNASRRSAQSFRAYFSKSFATFAKPVKRSYLPAKYRPPATSSSARLMPKTNVLRMVSVNSSLLMLNNILNLTGMAPVSLDDLMDAEDDES